MDLEKIALTLLAICGIMFLVMAGWEIVCQCGW